MSGLNGRPLALGLRYWLGCLCQSHGIVVQSCKSPIHPVGPYDPTSMGHSHIPASVELATLDYEVFLPKPAIVTNALAYHSDRDFIPGDGMTIPNLGIQALRYTVQFRDGQSYAVPGIPIEIQYQGPAVGGI